MSRTILRRSALAAALLFTLTACGGATDPSDEATTPAATETTEATEASEPAADETTAEAGFPVTVTHTLGEVTIEAAPEAIVSLSPAATEILFAIGAGGQVVATDSFSTFPAEAPTTDLSGFDPNVEAILEFEPDLVVASQDRNDLVAALEAVDVPVLVFDAAVTFDDAFGQFTTLGAATGNVDGAATAVAGIEADLAEIAASVEVEPGLTYYHELDPTLFSATSNTFIGEIYGLFGMVNIADEAADQGDYPQLSAEFIVEADPDYVFLADTICCAITADEFAARDGFGGITAVADGNVVELNDDIASRWGPRMVEFARVVADALAG
jgi:iron complex transport system substrate-binding protein